MRGLLKTPSAIACVETGLHMNEETRKLSNSRSGEEHRQFGVGAFRVRRCADLFYPERHFFCHRWRFHIGKRISQLVNTLSVEAFCVRITRNARRRVLSVREDFVRLTITKKIGCSGALHTGAGAACYPSQHGANFNVGKSGRWRQFLGGRATTVNRVSCAQLTSRVLASTAKEGARR